ncbi:TRPM8 channel-associated factor homolog [Synchiropus splendidus]|uniref:TRPM8 channel-associated factor homolog n=1 Tax=Synchiropus splendidus TaxID=270530 RepID=UPI00237DBE15|nr:TRPM8 channel-associated factor homolog [Synchiropus splendidus]
MSSQHVQAYSSLMKGLTELDIRGSDVPSVLDLVGDRAFPLVMNSHGQILMAASMYGSGRIVVLGHEGFLTAFPALTENAVFWLQGDGTDDRPVGVHQTVEAVADSLSKSCSPTTVVDGFDKNLELAVFVTDAKSVSGKEEDLVEFLRCGGGVLIAGHDENAAQKNPAENTKFHFVANAVTSVAGIYFTQHPATVELLPVPPQIPSSWKSLAVRHRPEDDLEVLLQGISEFNLVTSHVPSELLVHGPKAFPIGATENGETFLAGAHYGKGRIVVIGQEGLLGAESLVPFWKNAVTWLDQGRNGTIGVSPTLPRVYSLFTSYEINCQQRDFSKDLSVFVCKAYIDEDKITELQEFVAEGGGMLVGGQGWYWAHTYRKKNVLTDFPANKFLYKMGVSILGKMIANAVYQAPHPSRDIREAYHLRHMIHHFTAHMTQGTDLTKHEEANLKKLGSDSAVFLQMKAHHCASYSQLLDVITDVVKTCGLPQVTESTPVSTAKDHALLHMGAGLYRAHPNRDKLLPHLIKDIPSLPVVNNYKVIVDADTTGGEEWISTGLYLSPGMETSVVVPEQIVDKGWEIQIGSQADTLRKDLLKRPPRVCVRFPVTARETEVYNLYGGLIYLVAPHQTQMSELEITVELAVLAPYYKFGVTTAEDWSKLRSAPAPWAELEFDNIILTVPSRVVRELEKPEELAEHWNSIMKAIADLAVIPTKFLRKERFVTDVQISHGLMHAGYPIMSHQPTAAQLVSIEHMMSKGLWGPIHELGHNQQRGCWEFKPHTTECTCNIWTVYVHEEVFKIPRAKAYPGLTPEKRKAQLDQHVKKGRKMEDWTVFVALETYLQLQEKFGWDAVKNVFAAYHNMTSFPADNQGKMNLYAETFSQVVGMNLCEFFKAWSWPIDPITEEKLCHLPAWTDHPMVHYD